MVSIQAQLWKKQDVFGFWEMLLSNFGITNWKDVTVYWPFVEHLEIQHLRVFLAYLILLGFLILCFVCNTQKVTKCQTSALGNAFITYLCCFFFFFFPAFFFPRKRQCFWPLVIFSPRVLILQLQNPFFSPMLLQRSPQIILVLFTLCIVVHVSQRFLLQNIFLPLLIQN